MNANSLLEAPSFRVGSHQFTPVDANHENVRNATALERKRGNTANLQIIVLDRQPSVRAVVGAAGGG